jgi:hypothetical protein
MPASCIRFKTVRLVDAPFAREARKLIRMLYANEVMAAIGDFFYLCKRMLENMDRRVECHRNRPIIVFMGGIEKLQKFKIVACARKMLVGVGHIMPSG